MVIGVILAVLVFGFLIFIHEAGHFLFARLFGVKVNEFSMGMGPKLISKTSKKTGIVYSLRALPIGGFVSMAGEDEESDDPSAFCNKPVWQRMIITAAGAVVNIIAGIIAMAIITAVTGNLGGTQIKYFGEFKEDSGVLYSSTYQRNSFEEGDVVAMLACTNEETADEDGKKLYDVKLTRKDVSGNAYDVCIRDMEVSKDEKFLAVGDTIQGITNGDADGDMMYIDLSVLREGSAVDIKNIKVYSEKTGLLEGDKIIKIGGTKVHTYSDMAYEIQMNGAAPIDVTVLRNGENVVVENMKFSTVEESGIVFGLPDFATAEESLNIESLFRHTVWRCISMMRSIWASLMGLVMGDYGVEMMSGPVGVGSEMAKIAKQSYADFAALAVLISINLGIMNLLPLPALDGGRLVFQFVELIIRRPVNKNIEAYVHFGGIVILMAFMLFITFKDIFALF